MTSVNTHTTAAIRVVNGQTTADYITVTFYDLPTLPGMPPDPETTIVAGGEKLVNGNVATIVVDETVIMQPIPFDLRFRLESEKIWQLDAFGNPRGLATWNVGTTPTVWVPVAVADIGTRENSEGVAITVPGPKVARQINHLFNVEVKLTAPADAPSGVDFVHRLLGCATVNFTHELVPGGVFFNLSCLCYGQIDTQAADFSAGTETT